MGGSKTLVAFCIKFSSRPFSWVGFGKGLFQERLSCRQLSSHAKRNNGRGKWLNNRVDTLNKCKIRLRVLLYNWQRRERRVFNFTCSKTYCLNLTEGFSSPNCSNRHFPMTLKSKEKISSVILSSVIMYLASGETLHLVVTNAVIYFLMMDNFRSKEKRTS